MYIPLIADCTYGLEVVPNTFYWYQISRSSKTESHISVSKITRIADDVILGQVLFTAQNSTRIMYLLIILYSVELPAKEHKTLVWRVLYDSAMTLVDIFGQFLTTGGKLMLYSLSTLLAWFEGVSFRMFYYVWWLLTGID